ncbi:MAG: helix-turn-helix domain-containing protein [Clostridiales bacterium]|jgi:transcriptional regulator with XRE-family HTH domain|nr:helix-turn-helix domain-containing protein [Clostridiales bacterium]
MRVLTDFGERLSELMLENNLTTDQLGAALGVNGSSVRRWKHSKRNISLACALRLAEYFNCSLAFLVGRTDNKLDFVPQPYPSFYERLRQVMEERGVTWYRIVKDGIVSDNNLSTWKNGSSPFLQTVLDIADYFDCSLDRLERGQARAGAGGRQHRRLCPGHVL